MPAPGALSRGSGDGVGTCLFPNASLGVMENDDTIPAVAMESPWPLIRHEGGWVGPGATTSSTDVVPSRSNKIGTDVIDIEI